MTKTKAPKLEGFVSIRLPPADVELLDAVTRMHPLARRGAVAREALRRGLMAMKEGK